MTTGRIVVYPFKMNSESGTLLSKELRCFKVYPDRQYVPQKNDLIVNWGNGHTPIWASKAKELAIVLNYWKNVNLSINKKHSFSGFKAAKIKTPEWTHFKEMAQDWFKDGSWVVCRTQINGRDGSGLYLAKKPSELVLAPLYTRYIPIEREFRIYVFKGKTIDILEKRRDSNALSKGGVNSDIRTEHNHWVFCRRGVFVDDTSEAENAIKALGLDFGGVDVIQSSEDKKYYVLETNTAPGILGTTVTKFAQEILNFQRSI